MSTPLKLAVPNKGRLEAPTARLLREAGLSYERGERTLAAPVRNVDIEVLFVRAGDVCELVADGVAALGITGLDLVAESEAPLRVLTELDYGRCRLVAAVPSGFAAESITDFEGLRVATAHPVTTEKFFEGKGVAVQTVPLQGSVEVAPKLGVADAIVDLVSSGSTMLVNGLRQVATLLESQAALVAPEGAVTGEPARVTTMLRAVTAARRKRYVLMNAPASAVVTLSRLIPGLESPTIVPLAHDGRVSVQSVVDADDLWGLLPELEQAGASGILVLPVQQLIA